MQQTQRTQIISHLAMFLFLKEALFATPWPKTDPFQSQIQLHQLSRAMSESCNVVVSAGILSLSLLHQQTENCLFWLAGCFTPWYKISPFNFRYKLKWRIIGPFICCENLNGSQTVSDKLSQTMSEDLHVRIACEGSHVRNSMWKGEQFLIK